MKPIKEFKTKSKIKKYYKTIEIPSKEELQNIIINIYTCYLLQYDLFISNKSEYYLAYYIKSITETLQEKIKNNTYDFTLKELIDFIYSGLRGMQTYKLNGDVIKAIDPERFEYPCYLQDPIDFLNKSFIHNCEYGIIDQEKYIKILRPYSKYTGIEYIQDYEELEE